MGRKFQYLALLKVKIEYVGYDLVIFVMTGTTYKLKLPQIAKCLYDTINFAGI